MVDQGGAGGGLNNNNKSAISGAGAASSNPHAREYLMGLEDKPLMDEFVALYLGMQNKSLER